MTKKLVQRLCILTIVVSAFFLLGCGGGGGGGSGDVGVGTITPTPTPTAPATPIPQSGNFPTGFDSAAFPKQGTTISVSPQDGKSAVVMVNNGATNMNVSLSSAVGAFQAKIAAAKEGANEMRASVPVSKDGAFHAYLRDSERRMPGFRSVTASKNAARAAIRTDVVGQKTTFSIYMGPGISARSVTATCRVIKTLSTSNVTVNFYFDDAATYDSDAANMIGNLNDSWANTYSTDRAVFGSEPPSDFNNLGSDITVLLSPQIDTAGFFYSGDLYPPSQVQGGISNQRKMFYLQYVPSETTEAVLSSTMAHEFQHMINFYQRKLVLGDSGTEDDWLNEAMSGYAEHVCGYPASRNQSKALQINAFFAAVANLPLVKKPWPQDHENYGQVYLFATWLAEHYAKNGSMQALLSSKKVGADAVAEFTGLTFGEVFGQWMVALYANDTTGGLYGYKDLDMHGTYSFGSSLRNVTLTGPARIGISSSESTGSITVGAYSSAFVEVTGSKGATMNLTLPSGVSSFELHKL